MLYDDDVEVCVLLDDKFSESYSLTMEGTLVKF